MNQRTNQIRALLASVQPHPPKSNITHEARYIRELFKGEPFEDDLHNEDEAIDQDDSSSSDDEKVIDVKSQIDEIMRARRERGLPTFIEGPKKGNLYQ